MNLKISSMEPINMTSPMNRNYSAVIHLVSMISKKCDDYGDNYVLVSRINWRLEELEK